MWKLAGLATVMAVLWPTGQIARAITATPNPTMRHIERLERISMEGRRADEPTAWPVYQRIADEVFKRDERGRGHADNPVGDRSKTGALLALARGDWSDPTHEPGRQVLDALRRDFFPALAEAVSIPALGVPHGELARRQQERTGAAIIPAHLHSVEFPLTNVLLASMFVAEMRRACEEEDWDGFLAIVELAMAARSHLYQTAVVSAMMWANRLPVAVSEELRRLLNEHRLPREVCERLLELLDVETFPDDRSARLWLMGWRIQFDGYVEAYFGSNGVEARWMTDAPDVFDEDHNPVRAMAFRIMNIGALFYPDVGETLRARDYYFEAIDVWRTIPRERRPHRPGLPRWVMTNSAVFEFAHMIEAPLVSTGDRLPRSAVSITATRLMLRLNLYYLEHGRWPDALEDAAPREEIIDPRVGEPFRYALTPDASDGRPYDLLAPASVDPPRGQIPPHPALNPPREPLPEHLLRREQASVGSSPSALAAG